jgi:putative DNA primase/helicase
LEFAVDRIERDGGGKRKKSFRQKRPDPDHPGEWVFNVDGCRALPYRLPQLLRAIADGQPVFIVEGEGKADLLASWDLVATCNAGGAGKWKAEHSAFLKDADVFLVPDHDGAGWKHVNSVGASLAGIAKCVRILVLPGLRPKGDIKDWVAAGGTREQLNELIAKAPNWTPPQPDKDRDHKGDGGGGEDDADTLAIKRLAALSAIAYEQQRKAAAEKLGVRASILDKLVQAERPDDDDGKQGSAISFPEPEPWSEPVDGAELLKALADAIRSYVVMSDAARDTTALWTLHSYLIDRALVSPRLAITSPTKRCGKTTLLDVLGRVALKPLFTAHVTPPAMFRTVEAYQPTLLIDEADTFLKGKNANEELRGIINSGHRKGGSVLRTVGDDHEPRAFATYAACAIALIGRLPETLHDRSVITDLKRRMLSEPITPFRPDRVGHLDVLAQRAARWAKDNSEPVGDADDPELPDGIFNREADNWRPLLAIADAAGGDWPKRARDALKAAHTAEDDESRLTLLLGDVLDIFVERKLTTPDDRLGSKELVEDLAMIEGRPWAEYGRNDKPITQNQFARALKPLGIAPQSFRQGKSVARGYTFGQFAEAFERYQLERYLAVLGVSQPLHPYKRDECCTSDTFKPLHAETDVAVEKCEKPNNDGHCNGVAIRKGGESEETRVCEHCRAPEHPDDPVLECWVNGEQCFLHRGCQGDWLAASPAHDAALPPGSNFLGMAPGQRCELCGSGRDVYLIQLPGEQEGAPRHKQCAARYWEKRH